MHVPPELVESARRGEPGAFDELVRLTHRSVYSLVYRLVGNTEDASDVTQDVYLRAWRSIRRFRGDSEFTTWLHRIAANAALTFLKRRARSGRPVAPEDLPEEPVSDGSEERAEAEVLEAALASLPPEHRNVVILKDVYGWSCEEIARKMGSTEGAIKVRLFRARQRLADELSAGGVVVRLNTKKKRTS